MCGVSGIELDLNARFDPWVTVFALFHDCKAVRCGTVLAFVAEIAAIGTSIALIAPEQSFNSSCWMLGSPRPFSIYWYAFPPSEMHSLTSGYRISSLVFETILFALTVYKYADSFHTLRKSESLLFIMFRDGAWAFAAVFSESDSESQARGCLLYPSGNAGQHLALPT